MTPASGSVPPGHAVTIRPAFPDDAQALARLAALDSAQSPPAPVLVAEIDGELLAAMSLADGSVVADPFHRTAALLELLSARARQLTRVRPALRTRASAASTDRARWWRVERRWAG